MDSRGEGERPEVLFISRKHPPSVGGMERLSYDLISSMRKRLPCYAIVWGYSQKYLPLFLPLAFFRSLYHLSSGRIDLIHVGDGLLSPFGFLLKKISGRPVAVNLHGLDMTFPNPLYQWMIRVFLPRLDYFISISQNTKAIALQKGVPEDKICVIPCGIQIENQGGKADKSAEKRELEKLIGKEIEEKKIAVTVGRLVKRKGVSHFVSEILPQIIDRFPNLIYLVVGEGEEEEQIRKEIDRRSLEDHAVLLGRVNSEGLDMLYDASDLFIMPNIEVEGDVEGFGIVALEASLTGLPIVAFAVEGILDAITDGANGILLKPGDDPGFADKIVDLLNDDEKRKRQGTIGKEFTKREFSWDTISMRYQEFFKSCVPGGNAGVDLPRKAGRL